MNVVSFGLSEVSFVQLATGKWCGKGKKAGGVARVIGSRGKCQDACTEKTECNFFAFDTGNNWCTTYSDCGTPTKGRPNQGVWKKVSPTPDEQKPPRFNAKLEGDCPHMELIDTMDPELCLEAGKILFGFTRWSGGSAGKSMTSDLDKPTGCMTVMGHDPCWKDRSCTVSLNFPPHGKSAKNNGKYVAICAKHCSGPNWDCSEYSNAAAPWSKLESRNGTKSEFEHIDTNFDFEISKTEWDTALPFAVAGGDWKKPKHHAYIKVDSPYSWYKGIVDAKFYGEKENGVDCDVSIYTGKYKGGSKISQRHEVVPCATIYHPKTEGYTLQYSNQHSSFNQWPMKKGDKMIWLQIFNEHSAKTDSTYEPEYAIFDHIKGPDDEHAGLIAFTGFPHSNSGTWNSMREGETPTQFIPVIHGKYLHYFSGQPCSTWLPCNKQNKFDCNEDRYDPSVPLDGIISAVGDKEKQPRFYVKLGGNCPHMDQITTMEPEVCLEAGKLLAGFDKWTGGKMDTSGGVDSLTEVLYKPVGCLLPMQDDPCWKENSCTLSLNFPPHGQTAHNNGKYMALCAKFCSGPDWDCSEYTNAAAPESKKEINAAAAAASPCIGKDNCKGQNVKFEDIDANLDGKITKAEWHAAAPFKAPPKPWNKPKNHAYIKVDSPYTWHKGLCDAKFYGQNEDGLCHVSIYQGKAKESGSKISQRFEDIPCSTIHHVKTEGYTLQWSNQHSNFNQWPMQKGDKMVWTSRSTKTKFMHVIFDHIKDQNDDICPGCIAFTGAPWVNTGTWNTLMGEAPTQFLPAINGKHLVYHRWQPYSTWMPCDKKDKFDCNEDKYDPRSG